MSPANFITTVVILALLSSCSKDPVHPSINDPIKGNPPVLPPATAPRDTTVILPQPGPQFDSLVFERLNGDCPWHTGVLVKFGSLLYGRTIRKVFIRRENDPAWMEVPHLYDRNYPDAAYHYFLERSWPDYSTMQSYGTLNVIYYGNDISDKPAMKIKF